MGGFGDAFLKTVFQEAATARPDGWVHLFDQNIGSWTVRASKQGSIFRVEAWARAVTLEDADGLRDLGTIVVESPSFDVAMLEAFAEAAKRTRQLADVHRNVIDLLDKIGGEMDEHLRKAREADVLKDFDRFDDGEPT